MRIVLVGGGTGGHFYPLIAIAEAVRGRDLEQGRSSELFYLGPNPYSQSSLDELAIKFVKVPAGKNRVGYGGLLNFLDLFKTAFGVMVAFFKLLLIYPDVVMSKGGYTSVPVVLAAWLLRIPIVVHESDAVPGRANLLAARFARYIGIAHAEVTEYFDAKKVAHVGMPIRSVISAPISDPYNMLGIPKDRPVILVTGGSLGAERLNNFIITSLSKLLQEFTVVHQVGEANVKNVSSSVSSLFEDHEPLSHYFVFGQLGPAQFAAALQAANLVIARAGSTTLFEIAQNGKPSIIIPIPEGLSRDQRSNAYAYARGTGAIVLEEHNLSDDILVAEINRIIKDEGVTSEMSTKARSLTVGNAAYTLADTLTAIAREHE
ncbi:MAG: UDP-N-acetylglucosamine--N-acetylmuramyl-(pentapeptide) pyrophosphoryl-undecaprenol N-acetylglucosamine transferase [Candidatus Paceibacterota bacterium]